MDIVICGAQVPFMSGGAELLMENLRDALEAAGHRAELVRLPTAWDRERVFDSAMAWRLAPIDADVVIATNFPSYYVRHPRKVVWLFHQHRGFTDAADATWSDLGFDDESLELQRQLAEWDTRALEEAVARFTISRVVADRLARFCGLHSEALYHPPPLFERLRPGGFGDFIFSATRLEANKRPDLLVEAMAHAGPECRLLVAGRGSMRTSVGERAAQPDLAGRVQLLGFVPDDELIDHFAGCRAVMYVPHEEDYGYVTLQAFAAGKPVITTSDSGGVLEWVDDGVTGIVTDGSPEQLGAAVQRLTDDVDLAREMGRRGRERVAGLDWQAAVQTLLEGL